MFKASITFLIICITCNNVFSQQNTTHFNSPDTICITQTFTVQNNSSGAISSTYWSLCSNTLATAPQYTNLGTLGGTFDAPVYMSLNNDGGNYYMFVTNNSSGAISRLAYGNSLNNTPVTVDLGTLGGNVPSNAEGIYITKEGANWFGVVVGGPFGTIAKLNFGNSLANIPTCVNMGNIGGLNYPHNIQIFNVGNNIYGFTVNRSGNTITRFSFGNSINNTPTGVNLGNIGSVNEPSQLSLINYSGNWYMFICNDGDNTLTRLDFGNSLLNTPTGTNIGNPGNLLNGPRGISISVECNKIKGLIANRGNDILMNMDFSSGPTGAVVLTSLGNPAGLSFPQTIERYTLGDVSVYFIVNVWNNTISRIDYPNCTSLPSSTSTNLSPFNFPSPGIYTVTLMNNFGLYNQSVYCKNTVVVLGSNVTVNASTTNICSGTSVSLTASGISNYTWNPGAIVGNSIVINPLVTTTYSVIEENVNGCKSNAAVTINVTKTPTLVVSQSTASICEGNKANLSVTGATNYTWNPGQFITNSIVVSPSASTIYTIIGTIGTCTNVNIATLNVMPNPTVVIANASTIICNEPGSTSTISASGANQYSWNPTSSVSSSIIVNPEIPTIYKVIGLNSFGCSQTSTLLINVFPNLSFSINQFSVCSGNSVTITANGAQNYNWQPGNKTDNVLIDVPKLTTTYTLTEINGVCSKSQTFSINVIENPIVEITEVITPNDDGKNEQFKIFTSYPTKIKITIFNRWGSLVYENDNYDNSWNGYAAGSFQVGHNKLPQGTYYYIIELDDCDHQVVKGFVVIQY